MMFDSVETYSCDLPLLKELGLQPFNVPIYTDHFIGEVKLENESIIKMWVNGAPAQFFKAEIYCSANKRIYKVSTGSGNLTHYYSMFKEIADDMLVINSIY